MMQFTPKTEKEITEMGLWSAGIYSFEIIQNVSFGGKAYATTDAKSKSGNDMIVLIVQVYDQSGEKKILIDYLLEAAASKLRSAAVACGLINRYETGALLAYEFIGKTGQLRLGVEKDKEGKYPDKNKIINYVADEAVAKTPLTGDLDDSIPF